MKLYFAFFTLVISSLLPAEIIASACADLSLVLAIDSSGSIDSQEFEIQQQGYVAAFLDSGVQAALASAGRVDIAVAFWADSDFSPQILPWHHIRSRHDAQKLSFDISMVNRLSFGDTDIGNGLSAALDLIELPGRCTVRSMVNLSGDGKASVSSHRAARIPLPVARKRAADLGVTVNALAITNVEPDLAAYFRDQLITGPDAFVIEVTGFDTFGAAIIRKLIREISATLIASLQTDLRY